MNKTELVTAVTEKLAGAEPDARQYIDAVFDTIMHRVATGERVQIIGFGTFDSVERAARVGHNPRSGAQIQVAASVAPRFQAGQTFRAQVKESLAPSAETAAEVVAVTVTEAAAVTKPAKTKAAKKSVAEKAAPEKAATAKAVTTKPVTTKAAAKKPEKPVKTAAKTGPVKTGPAKPKDAKAAAKKSAKTGKTGRK
jgi:DNA-binding protein HU-beta